MFLDSVTLGSFVRELKERLVEPAFFNKFSQLGEQDYYFVFRGTGALYCSLKPSLMGLWVWTRPKPQAQVPSSFVMLVRKHCVGKPLSDVAQVNGDRIVRFEFAECALILELLPRQGNLLLERQGKLLGAHRWDRERQMRPGRPYVAPVMAEPRLTEDGEMIDVPPRVASEVRARAAARESANKISLEEAWVDHWADWMSARIRPGLTRQGALTCWARPDENHFPNLWEASIASLERVFPDSHFAASLDLRQRLSQALSKMEDRLKKLESNLEADISRVDQADTLQLHADLLMAHPVPRGAKVVELPSWDGTSLVKITLDPAVPVREQAQRLYKKAAKYRRAVPILQGRLEEAGLRGQWLAAMRDALERAETEPDLEALRDQLEAAKPARRSKPAGPVSGPRRFKIADFDLWVGRNPKQNEELLRRASRADVWAHVREGAGSHVIVRTGGRPPNDEVLRAAAVLAARYSALRKDSRVQVAVTPVAKVRKVAGAAPGLVTYRDEQIVTVDPNEELRNLQET